VERYVVIAARDVVVIFDVIVDSCAARFPSNTIV